ncbi:hypothetical protein D0T50_09845 [Bacteroides sp. 214]|uniref:hypothetical protein n=1 Tax=Bacteroides sp. 214 TaxID=2302935 RepID=UPI0013D079BB|nr:hypothetical protein [Bacteroides sp. 214]NDW13195.1 hypothetical protein [Bacteroides sp. 214]
MITTRIEIPPHLKEYCVGKFNNHAIGAIRFPDNTDIYHLIWDLLERRPKNCPVDKGNLEIVLPHRACGKSPQTYNYLSIRSQAIIIKKIQVMMWAEFHEFVDANKHLHGLEYIQSVHYFTRKYDITSISEDAFIKNFYRWRELCRKKRGKRNQ